MKTSLSLISISLTAALLCGACGKTPERVQFADVCGKDSGSVVSIEGFFHFPAADWPGSSEETDKDPSSASYKLLLVEQQNGTGGFLYARVESAEKPEPNRMTALAQSYTYDDFHLYTNNAKAVSPDEKVKVTGEVVREKVGCVLKVTKIETP